MDDLRSSDYTILKDGLNDDCDEEEIMLKKEERVCVDDDTDYSFCCCDYDKQHYRYYYNYNVHR